MRIIVIFFLLAILGSLGSALFYLFRDRGHTKRRMVKALTLRVGLSIGLFVLLMAAYYFGWISGRV